MVTRREALQMTGAAIATAIAHPGHRLLTNLPFPFHSRRPIISKRAFTSQAVEDTITSVSADISDPEVVWLFSNCFPNTLDTTVNYRVVNGQPDTFVITGDIHAMWLRDSSAQVWPYLRLVKHDRNLRSLLAGVIRKQTRCILIDPYANAFNDGPGKSEWVTDETDMKPELHERKWEIDSLCYPIRLAHGYWKETEDDSVCDGTWIDAMRLVVNTFGIQQRKKSRGPYHFQRRTTVWYDTLPLGGYGNPTRPVGLIHSGFRPSDDACIFPFLIPSNLFAVQELRHISEMLGSMGREPALAREASDLAEEVEAAVREYGVFTDTDGSRRFAYEVDGFGNRLCMDDANVPSLLALPYLGCTSIDDPVYRSTRSMILSEENPYFFKGTVAEGIGGPHVGPDMIWPISVIIRAFTSADDGEILRCLRTLKNTHAGTGFMHESFHKDDASKFTRSWFAWANTLFGELVLHVHSTKPELLKQI